MRPECPISLSLRLLSGMVAIPSPNLRYDVVNRFLSVETAIVVEYPLVWTSCAGPACLPFMGKAMVPLLDMAKRLAPMVAAVLLVSAFCSSKGERSVAQMSPTWRISLDTL